MLAHARTSRYQVQVTGAEGGCIVVGGGIVGCAIALGLRDRGLAVTVVDRSAPGSEASWAAAGILAPQLEAHGPGPFIELMRAGVDRWRGYAGMLQARTGLDVGYRDDGALDVAFDDEEAARLLERARWQRGAGLPVETLSARELAALEPSLAPATLALRIPDGHQVDTRRAMRALVGACTAAGVAFVETEVRRLRHDRGRVIGIDSDAGARDAATVIVAGGAWSTQLDGVPMPRGAVHPVRGQMIELRASAPPLRHVVFGGGGYLVPRADGRVLCGSTEEDVGYLKEVTAAGLGALSARATRLCPALAALPVADHWAGLRPASADALPYIGATAVSGLWLASGHFRNGVLLAPLTAEIVVALVTGDTVPVDVTALSPSRA
ncbi:MAG: thiO [Myxococcales bacterium]|nr:thiO [Myxococcales bacterium]